MPEKAIIFYDGNCGLCHGIVKFVLKRDTLEAFKFSPLQGETFKNSVDPDALKLFPDSVIVQDVDGKLYLKAFGVKLILQKLGWFWKSLAFFSSLLPWRFKNHCYDFIANTRYKIFSRKKDFCPLVPVELKNRFLA